MFDLISCLKGEPGYVEDRHCYKVFLDGGELVGCESADVVLGEAVCFKTDVNGHFYFDDNNEGIATEILYGEIEIVRIENCKKRVNLRRKDQ